MEFSLPASLALHLLLSVDTCCHNLVLPYFEQHLALASQDAKVCRNSNMMSHSEIFHQVFILVTLIHTDLLIPPPLNAHTSTHTTLPMVHESGRCV